MPSPGVGLICNAMSLHLQSMPSIPRQKICKKITIWREISASKVSNMYRNNRHHMYPSTQRSGLGSGWHLVRLLVIMTFSQMYPQNIWWPSVIPYQVITVKSLILLLFVETTKLKSYLNSYHPMQKKNNTVKVIWTWKDNWLPWVTI